MQKTKSRSSLHGLANNKKKQTKSIKSTQLSTKTGQKRSISIQSNKLHYTPFQSLSSSQQSTITTQHNLALTQQKRQFAAPTTHKAFQTLSNPTVVAGSSSAAAMSSAKAKFRQDMLKSYNRDGYILMKNLFFPQDVDLINKEMVEICRGKSNNIQNVIGISPVSDDVPDNEVLSAYSTIEMPHKAFSSELLALIFQDKELLTALRAVIGPNIKCVSSEYLIQSVGEYRSWYQAENIINTRDKSLIQAIIALDDLSIQSGTILVQPASHRGGFLYPCKSEPDGGMNSGSDTSFDWQSFAKPSKTIVISASADELDPLLSMTSVPIEISAGSVLLVNGYTLQRMMANPTDKLRRVLHLHFTSATTMVSWNIAASDVHAKYLEGLSREQLMDVRDIQMILGSDPYEYKGIHDIWPTFTVRRRGAPAISPL